MLLWKLGGWDPIFVLPTVQQENGNLPGSNVSSLHKCNRRLTSPNHLLSSDIFSFSRRPVHAVILSSLIPDIYSEAVEAAGRALTLQNEIRTF